MLNNLIWSVYVCVCVCGACLSVFIWVTAPAVGSQQTNWPHLSHSSRFTHSQDWSRSDVYVCSCVWLKGVGVRVPGVNVCKISVTLDENVNCFSFFMFHLNLERVLDQCFGHWAPEQRTGNLNAHLCSFYLHLCLADDFKCESCS